MIGGVVEKQWHKFPNHRCIDVYDNSTGYNCAAVDALRTNVRCSTIFFIILCAKYINIYRQ